jgi:hypothetical protein
MKALSQMRPLLLLDPSSNNVPSTADVALLGLLGVSVLAYLQSALMAEVRAAKL